MLKFLMKQAVVDSLFEFLFKLLFAKVFRFYKEYCVMEYLKIFQVVFCCGALFFLDSLSSDVRNRQGPIQSWTVGGASDSFIVFFMQELSNTFACYI